jgi:ATP-dependent DNA helicase RecG
MNLKELRAVVAKGESDRVEFKRSTGQPTEGAKTVCALANGLGGLVRFGRGYVPPSIRIHGGSHRASQ